MKASIRTLNSVVARCGQFTIARPDLTKSTFVVLCDGEEMESFSTFRAACDACDKRKLTLQELLGRLTGKMGNCFQTTVKAKNEPQEANPWETYPNGWKEI